MMTSRILISALLLCSLASSVLALPTVPHDIRSLPRSDAAAAAVTIDGHLDEAIWAEVPVWDDFRIIEPDTLVRPAESTRVRVFYSDDGLYVGVEADQDPATLVKRLTARDQGVNRDSISITIDPTGEGRYGYWFTVALGGSIQDGTVVPERNYSSEWDGPWEGASAETETGWSAEFFLPWSMMAMPAAGGDRRMGFYISRKVAHRDERWAMPALPRTQTRFMSVLKPLGLEGVQPASQLTFYPFASTTFDARKESFSNRIGTDLYWRPSSDTQFAVTLNPDFGTVEQDDLVVNLSAFETFFSEKRSFFLEGQELFVTSPRATGDVPGVPRMLLVNTRRIGAPGARPEGVSIDRLEAQRLSELHGAARVSAQHGNVRYGALAALEQDSRFAGFDALGTPLEVDIKGRRFAAVRGVWDGNGDSSLRGLGATLTAVEAPDDDAYVGAVDGRIMSPDGTWKVDTQAMVSHTDSGTGHGFIADTVYAPRQGLRHTLSVDLLDDRLDLDAFGFLSRNDSRALRYRYERTRSDLESLREQRTTVRVIQGWNSDSQLVNSGLFLQRNWTYNDLSQSSAELQIRPARWDDRNSRGNGAFRIDDRFGLALGWNSDSSRALSVGLGFDASNEDLGDVTWLAEGHLEWRPRDNLSTRVDLLYRERNGWLLHQRQRDFTLFDAVEWRPRLALDYFFSARQHLRVSLQWVGLKASEADFRFLEDDGRLRSREPLTGAPADDFVISNLVFQVRYRWELAPLSDLFLLYSRGGALQDGLGRDFPDLFRTSFANPDASELVMKLRYRI